MRPTSSSSAARTLGGRRHGRAVFEVVERDAPNLIARLAVEVGEELHEPGQQIGLGDQQVDRERVFEGAEQFLQARTNGQSLRLAFCARQLQQVADTDGDQRTVDGLARPVALERTQELLPFAGIGQSVAVLGGVSPRGVDHHGLVGEPPVAHPGSTDAADRVVAELFGQGELQTRIQQGRGLA
jgi:hypothetical protein